MTEGSDSMTGYLHADYAQSLAEFGAPRELSGSQGWILQRRIPGSNWHDAMGCYPLFSCQDWSKLCTDLEELEHQTELVSFAAVTDPFGKYDRNGLARCFRDLVVPFKEHFVVDLARPTRMCGSSHHRRYARKALQQLSVERCNNPVESIDDWTDLYANLIARHNIEGMQAFSKSSFAKQLSVPGIIAFRARYEKRTVGMLLWYLQGSVGYYHLGAFSTIGYERRASFALFSFAINYFSNSALRWLDLGAGAGADDSATDGLSRFKRGWSTGTRPAYFCGRILNRDRYFKILQEKDIKPTNYFPAYRQGEFGLADDRQTVRVG